MTFCSSSSLYFVWLLSLCRWYKVEFPETSMRWSRICPSGELCSSCQQEEHLAVLPQKDWKKWKGRLFQPGWEIEKPEIGNAATKGGREEVHCFSSYFIRHPGHQGSWVSEYKLEIHSDLLTDGWWYLYVILLLLFHQCLKVGILLPSNSSFGQSEETDRGIFVETAVMEFEAVATWR